MAPLVVPNAMAVVVAIYVASALPVPHLVVAVVIPQPVRRTPCVLRVVLTVISEQLARWVLCVSGLVFHRLVRQAHIVVLLVLAVFLIPADKSIAFGATSKNNIME